MRFAVIIDAISFLALVVSACQTTVIAADTDPAAQSEFSRIVIADQPVAYWRFDATPKASDIGSFPITVNGRVDFRQGPRPALFPDFHTENRAVQFGKAQNFLRIADPGEASDFDFESGDSITIEAWVAPEKINSGGFAYIIGKGRTYLPGMVRENHNWALRLKGVGGSAALTFLFRSRGKDGEYHRWTSKELFGVGDGWHHVALAYKFGKKGSLKGWIDGEPTGGRWDLGGDTDRAPVVDNDEVWIGSAMGGQIGSTLNGGIDEVALYRRRLSDEQVRRRYRFEAPPVKLVSVPSKRILVRIFDGVPNKPSWKFRSLHLAEEFTTDIFALPDLPKRYSSRGIHVDRRAPLLVQCHADVTFPSGKQRLLMRSRDAGRLYIDDKLVAESPFYKITQEANGEIFDLDRSHAPNIRPLQRGDRQAVVEFQGDGKPHRVRFETLVGLKGRRLEMGEMCLCTSGAEGEFNICSFSESFPLTDSGWNCFTEFNRGRLMTENKRRRDAAGAPETAYWNRRHEYAREYVRKTGFEVVHTTAEAIANIDRMVLQKLKASNFAAGKSIDDLTFLRRATLDTIGVVPTREEIRAYLADPVEVRRASVIDRLLARPEWADSWVGYWQDVLAENPNIVNPSLNNTGPFRWWIHESFAENKPFDRFVTELVLMEGSSLYGGPAGFGLATANDVPMAAKSHVLGQAFLGVQMQCARCHDAPSHDVKQKDLFSLAAMLQRKPQTVPKTSSIDLPPEQLKHMAVKITLKPGESVAPVWSFDEFLQDEISEPLIRDPQDTRERLAVMLTAPENERFARTIVNRLWKRFIGYGLVEPVHDWEGATPTHPQLLEWLAGQFVANDYDIKYIARLILNSQLYQRPCVNSAADAAELIGPQQRGLTAEQLVDSLFMIAGKRFNAGLMAVDIDGARPANLSLNLGTPRKAWMFTSTSNERDRPGLALPFAQPFVTFLEQFGWRGARQNPVNDRPDDLTSLQPAEFLNGILVQRITRLSDEHSLTHLALTDVTVDQFVDDIYLRMFTRKPTNRERAVVTELLTEGFEQRRRLDAPLVPKSIDQRGKISWSNHLEQEATTIKTELQDLVRRGDPPTHRLESDWRERVEDVVWSLLNSPEFRFAP